MTEAPLKRLQSEFAGPISYREGLARQEQVLAELRRDDRSCGIVLGFEHQPVITLGVRGNSRDDLAVSDELLRSRGIDLVQVPRGGQATVHSPGQLVVYPCLRLRDLGLSPRCFVSKMEQVTQACLADFGIDAVKGEREPGLFVAGKKIAAFGFHISRGLTSHGIAINVANDLSLFELIRTCGISRQPITSLADLGHRCSVADVFAAWLDHAHDDLKACP